VADGPQARVGRAFLEQKSRGRLGSSVTHRDVALATPPVVAVTFDEHEIAGILVHPAGVFSHEPDSARANVNAAWREEHMLERQLPREFVDALGWRGAAGAGCVGDGLAATELGARPVGCSAAGRCC